MDSNDIKLVDFGLARNLDAEDELKSSFGTPDFVGKNCSGSKVVKDFFFVDLETRMHELPLLLNHILAIFD